MSGHNRWSQIKHKKGTSDAKKGVVFGKLAKAISIAARDNPDPGTNLRLKGEIDRARAVNMPNENIDRAVERFADKSAAALIEVQLECIGPGGVAIVVSAITDNSNRTISELKQLIAQRGGKTVPPGSVMWMMKNQTELSRPKQKEQLQQLLELLDEHNDVQEVRTNAVL